MFPISEVEYVENFESRHLLPYVSLGCSVRKGDGKLFVVVVGDGVEQHDVSSERRPKSSINARQGKSVQDGVKEEVEKLSRTGFASKIVFEYRDDYGDPEQAAKLASEIAGRPEVLCVIGHATSATTKAALPYYASAGIPILMPIATSPNVGKGPSGRDRYNNYFRLPPEDLVGQAPAAIQFCMLENFRDVALVYDSSDIVAPYSIPLLNGIQEGLAKKCKQAFELRGNEDLDQLADDVLGLRTDAIIFIGYSDKAQTFIGAVKRRKIIIANTNTDQMPRMILTDGCMTDKLDVGPLTTFLLFPCPPNNVLDDFVPTKPIELNDSYKVFARDAVKLLTHSITELEARDFESSKHKLSRRTLLAALGSHRGTAGNTSRVYSFIDGENTNVKYYVYKVVVSDDMNVKFELYREIAQQ